MYSMDDMRTPRDRVSDEFVRRMLEQDCAEKASPCACRVAGNTKMPVMPANEMAGNSRCRMLEGQSLAMVYSPCQRWRGIYAPDMALRRGTMFKELDMPLEAVTREGGCGCGK